jgi:hypothetical protein
VISLPHRLSILHSRVYQDLSNKTRNKIRRFSKTPLRRTFYIDGPKIVPAGVYEVLRDESQA